ncbi:MAG: transglycosylase SLT domain-containing protein [Paracoccaceae bacterium]
MILGRIVGVLLLLFPTLAAAEGGANRCNAAAVSSANDTAIPVDVLLALTLVETGRTVGGSFQPWPWTVNIEGKGHWFTTRAKVVDFIKQKYNSGARSFDIGCFQINHRWHGHAFTSFDQMFDPQANADYAAVFMNSLYKEGGSWSWAAGTYHSRTQSLAAKYRSRFDRIIANLATIDIPPVIAAAAPKSLSWWPSPQPLDIAPLSVVNGGLATVLLTLPIEPLFTTPTAALF